MALFGVFRSHRNRVLGALIGALAAQVLLRLPDMAFHGLPSLVALVAIAPALWSAYDRSPRTDRRRIRQGAAVVGLLGLAALLGLAVAAATARTQLQRGVDGTKAGLQAIRDGNQDQGVTHFDDASGSFSRAHDQLTALWAQPARLIPVVGQQVDALVGVADSGTSLSETAAVAAGTAPYHDLKASAGRLDLGVVRSMQAPVAASAVALHAAQARMDDVHSAWLIPPISRPINDFITDIDRTLPSAELARDGLAITPQMLGGEGTRHYLILFTTPAETRFQGGFTGAYGVLTADNGKVSLTRSGKIAELSNAPDASKRTLTMFPEFLERYGRYSPHLFFQNVTASPDLPTNAAVARELYRQTTGELVDGVMVADPYAIAALLQLTGSVSVPGMSQPLTPENAAHFLLVDQYVEFAADGDERNDRLGDAARATFDALTQRDLPGPGTLGDVLGPVMRQGRLLFTSFNADEETFLDRLGSTGRFAPTPQADYISLRTANANPSKIDTFLDRSIDYNASYTPETGTVRSTATIRLTNRAPALGLPRYIIGNDRAEPPGTNTMYLSFYTPLQVDRASLDGNPVGVEPQREFGGPVYSLLVSVPSGATITLHLELSGTVAAGAGYSLDVLNQPMANDDHLVVSVTSGSAVAPVDAADGLDVSGGMARREGTIDQDLHLSARVDGR